MNLHDVVEQCLERLAGVLEDARYEQRDGYTFLAFPTFPVRDLNGMWVDSDAASHISRPHVPRRRSSALRSRSWSARDEVRASNGRPASSASSPLCGFPAWP